MRKKKIALILWCVLVVGCFAAARSYLSAVLLTGTAAVVVFCAVSVKKSRTALSAKLSMPERIRQGKKKSGKLTLTDSSAFPLFCVKGIVCCKWESGENAEPDAGASPEADAVPEADAAPDADAASDDLAKQAFSCTIPSYRNAEITVKLNSVRAGVVHVWLKELTVCDLLGLFCHQADVSGICADVVVTPAPKQEQESEAAPKQEAAADVNKEAGEEQ